jgi:hypothetical protein
MGEAIVRRLADGGASAATAVRDWGTPGGGSVRSSEVSTRDGVDRVVRTVLDVSAASIFS